MHNKRGGQNKRSARSASVQKSFDEVSKTALGYITRNIMRDYDVGWAASDAAWSISKLLANCETIERADADENGYRPFIGTKLVGAYAGYHLGNMFEMSGSESDYLETACQNGMIEALNRGPFDISKYDFRLKDDAAGRQFAYDIVDGVSKMAIYPKHELTSLMNSGVIKREIVNKWCDDNNIVFEKIPR